MYANNSCLKLTFMLIYQILFDCVRVREGMSENR